MDASITIRLNGLGVQEQKTQTVPSRIRSESLDAEVHDEELMVRVRDGSREALAILFRRYARLVRAVGIRILCDYSEADDLLQEVFLFLHRKAGTFDSSKSSARSWIVQMTYHRAIDRRRYLQSRHFYTRVGLDDQVRHLTDPTSDLLPHDPFVDAGLHRTELQEFFRALSEDQQKTLHLYFFEGHTFSEISTALNQSLGNVKNHYYRGLDKLRKQIFTDKNRKVSKGTRK